MKDNHGIITVDSHYLGLEKYAACYILQSGKESAIIETNTNFAVPGILNSLEIGGLSPFDVKYVILTHVHLDHAGGAGKLMEELPNAELIVHPRGARHMISPEKLIKSVKQVYGEEKYKKMYGEVIPVPEDRVVEAIDGMNLKLGNKTLKIIESPGHAKHHIIVFDRSDGTVFSGDSFGIAYPRFRYEKGILIFPSTSPVQFDPENAVKTFKKIEDLVPESVYLTHFGRLKNISEIKRELTECIEFFVHTGKKILKSKKPGQELSSSILEELWKYFDSKIFFLSGKHLTDSERDFLFLDFDLNSKGVAFFLEKSGL